MAELKLKTRLLNKMSEDHIDGLLKGEINFYPVGDFLVMEVGGTDKPFAAKASDVAAWAKADVKPTYKAGEIEGLADYISGEIEDTNTRYSFEVDKGQIVIKYKEVKDEEYKDLTTIDIVTPDELATILGDYVTDTALDEALSNYVPKDDFDLSPYATITYVDGEIERVEGLVSAAEKKALADAKVYADGLVSAEASRADAAIEAAENAAKAYADGIKSDLLGDDLTTTFDTLKAVQDWVDEHGEAAADLTEGLANETKAREEADTALDGKITAEATARENADKALGERIDAAKAEAATDAQNKANAALEAAKADATTKADNALTAAKEYANSLNHEDTTYTPGTGLKLEDTVFSIDTDLVFILDAND